MTGRRRILASVGLALIIGVAIVLPRLASSSGPTDEARRPSLTTATVQRTDLAETTPVEGVVRFGGPGGTGAEPQVIVQPGGTTPSTLAQHRQAAAAADLTLAMDRQAAADAAVADDQAVALAEQSLAAARRASDAANAGLQRDEAILAADQERQRTACQGAGAPSESCVAAEAQVTADQRAVDADRQQAAAASGEVAAAEGALRTAVLKAAQTANQAQAKIAGDELALANARATAAASLASQTSYEPTSRYTSLPAVGQVVQPGEALWSIDGHPVALLPGTLTSWRAFSRGMAAGPDVAALDEALIALGHGAGLSVSNEFTSATARAIERLQAALGEPRTGVLPIGAVIFQPTAVRIAAVHPQIGAPIAPGAEVLDVTSTTPIVEVALPVGQSYLVEVGDPVTVTLPDRTTSDGTIRAVGTVATAADADGADGPSAATPPAATISVTIALTKTDGAASLDQAPVTVNITSTTVTDVLAVPTTALVALAGGGYALEVVDADGTHRLVPITAGIFDDQSGLVEVSGDGLDAGQEVVAPA